jgi:hypothetical protein
VPAIRQLRVEFGRSHACLDDKIRVRACSAHGVAPSAERLALGCTPSVEYETPRTAPGPAPD